MELGFLEGHLRGEDQHPLVVVGLHRRLDGGLHADDGQAEGRAEIVDGHAGGGVAGHDNGVAALIRKVMASKMPRISSLGLVP